MVLSTVAAVLAFVMICVEGAAASYAEGINVLREVSFKRKIFFALPIFRMA